jgi:hypothetical protein
MYMTNQPGDVIMIKLNRIVLGQLPALLAAGLLAHTSDALAAAPAGDAQAQAQQLLAAPRSEAAPGGVHREPRVPAVTSDAALSARGLILGGAGQEHLRSRGQTLQASVAPEAAPRRVRPGRQDAQAQARRLLHGDVA